MPAYYQSLADTVIAGEAEHVWPRFCHDLEAGNPQPLYQETGNVDLTVSPTPRFDLLKLDRYLTPCLQFSRGCPFRCEFCDIIVIFGRRPRTKSLEQVGAELDALRAKGVHNVFFDADTPAVFESHYRFIQTSGISVPMAGLLIAINRTPLWDRLERDGRLRVADSLLDGADNTGAMTNIEPLNMTYEQLVCGYSDLMRRLFTDEAIFERLANKMRDLPEQPLVENFLPFRKQPGVVWRTLRHVIAPGGWRRWSYFLRSLWWSKGRQARFSAIFDHWVKSIALQEFARMNFGTPQSSPQPLESRPRVSAER